MISIFDNSVYVKYDSDNFNTSRVMLFFNHLFSQSLKLRISFFNLLENRSYNYLHTHYKVHADTKKT